MSENFAVESLHNLDLNRAYRIYNTVHEMMQDRGYNPLKPKLNKKAWISRYLGYLAEIEDESSEMGVFEVIDNMTLMFSYREKRKKKLLVYFHPLDSKLCQNDMNYIHKLKKSLKAQRLIIVVNNNATPKVSSVLGILGHHAQLFSENELVFNVTKHQLVPKHERATEEEKEETLNTYTILPDGKQHPALIPGMFTTDPIAKYYNYEIGDLINISRPRGDGFVDLTFRVVTYPMADEKK